MVGTRKKTGKNRKKGGKKQLAIGDLRMISSTKVLLINKQDKRDTRKVSSPE